MWTGGRHRDAMATTEVMAQRALGDALAQLGSTKGPTTKTTMILDARSARRMIYYLLRGNSARSIHRGQSWWAGRHGEQLFPELLTIVDDPLIPRGLSSRHFDGEGLAARRLPLIEAGRLREAYVDTYYGRKAEMAPTTGSPSNRVITLGEEDLAGLMKGAGEGVLVTGWLGGNSDSNTGDFSLGMRGHMVRGGEVAEAVGEMNVTGNLVDLFSRLVAVGNDPWPWSGTLAPTLVFEDVQFSGA